jgi:hypothetical protein
MVTTIKLRDDLKRRLEELQARLLLERKEKINQQRLLEKLLEFSLEHVAMVFKTGDTKEDLEQDYAWGVLDKPESWGVSDASKHIDEYLYGGKS